LQIKGSPSKNSPRGFLKRSLYKSACQSFWNFSRKFIDPAEISAENSTKKTIVFHVFLTTQTFPEIPGNSRKFPEPPGNSRKFRGVPHQLNRTEQNRTEQNRFWKILKSTSPKTGW
jgi:hypothetical protein